jgi:hypothetical protein
MGVNGGSVAHFWTEKFQAAFEGPNAAQVGKIFSVDFFSFFEVPAYGNRQRKCFKVTKVTLRHRQGQKPINF